MLYEGNVCISFVWYAVSVRPNPQPLPALYFHCKLSEGIVFVPGEGLTTDVCNLHHCVYSPLVRLTVPRRACPSRGGPLCPEAGLSVPRRAVCGGSAARPCILCSATRVTTPERFRVQGTPTLEVDSLGRDSVRKMAIRTLKTNEAFFCKVCVKSHSRKSSSIVQGYLTHQKTPTLLGP